MALAACAAACAAPGTVKQNARAADEWTRSYTLAPAGELQIVNINGTIDVDASSGGSVAVRAERIVHAPTEKAASGFLAHIDIAETEAPDRVAIETRRVAGLMIGVSFEVNYHVTVPAGAAVRLRTNGSVRVTGIGGKASIVASNGQVTGRGLGGSVDARATNGTVDVEIVKGAAEFVDLRAVNGRVVLAVPASLDANLSATAVNGRVQVSDLEFEPFGDAPRDGRRVRGRVNGGGLPIELSATNGDVRVRGYE